jgi:hypothetical protein
MMVLFKLINRIKESFKALLLSHSADDEDFEYVMYADDDGLVCESSETVNGETVTSKWICGETSKGA